MNTQIDLNFPQAGANLYRTGLIGRGILASASPWLHEREASALSIPLEYTLFDFTARGWPDTALPMVISKIRQADYSGVNITFPFKQAIIRLLDEISAEAGVIGAVNTVDIRDGRLIGYNTDCSGFAAGFEAGLPDVDRESALQIGCGGAGSATAHAMLSLLGIGKLYLYDIDPARQNELYKSLADAYGTSRIKLVGSAEGAAAEVAGIVNSTPIGMEKFPGMPIAADAIEARHWVADVVYFPLVTQFLATAAAKSCRTLDGTRMVVNQAADAINIFLDVQVDRDRMQCSFAEYVRSGVSNA